MMLGKLFTLDNALMLGAFVIGPALLVGFLLLMGGFTRRSLLRRKRHPWSASDPAFKAAENVAAHYRVPVDRIRPQDRLIADLHLDHNDVAAMIGDVEDQPAASRFLRDLHQRSVADLGMLLDGISSWQ